MNGARRSPQEFRRPRPSKPSLEAGECRSEACGQEILWAVTAAGKRMPLDPKPEKRVVISELTGHANLVDTYMPHHATCAGAHEFRRSRA